MPDSRTAHVPWWPFILAIILSIALVALGIVFYLSYAHNVSLAHENDQLSSSILTLGEENTRLTKRVGELECVGTWDGEQCNKAAITLAATPTAAVSPAPVTLTARAPGGDYRIDFGDSASSTLSNTGTCTQEADGLCTFVLKHTYKLPAGATTTTSFSAKIMKDGNVEATTDIAVSKK